MKKNNFLKRLKNFIGRKICDFGLAFLRATRQAAIESNDFDEWQEMKLKLTKYRNEFDNEAI